MALPLRADLDAPTACAKSSTAIDSKMPGAFNVSSVTARLSRTWNFVSQQTDAVLLVGTTYGACQVSWLGIREKSLGLTKCRLDVWVSLSLLAAALVQ